LSLFLKADECYPDHLASQGPRLVFTPVLRHRENRLLATLPQETFALLEPDLKEISGMQGSVILEPGDTIDRIYFPQSGMISLLVVSREGHMVEVSTVGREGALGLHRGLGGRRSFTRATVQIPGNFSTITAHAFERFSLNTPEIREMIGRYTEMLWAEAQQLAACNAVHDASSRLCRWLLQCADQINALQLPLTQEFLAQMLGVRRTTVTLLAQELQKRGAVRYSRGKVTILSRKMLEDGACECYEVVQTERLALKLGVNW
jgi:CRP-like cAMP-binding protein